MARHSVNKRASARSFRKQVSRTKKANVRRPGRVGTRL